jgi:hypothetical protein
MPMLHPPELETFKPRLVYRFYFRNGLTALRTYVDEKAAYGAAYEDKEVIKLELLT